MSAALCAVALTACSHNAKPEAPALRGTVTYVVNGDTIHVRTTDRNERVRKGLVLAQKCSWESTVQQMQDLIKQAITKKERRSNRNIEPMTEAQLEYVYMATQGS